MRFTPWHCRKAAGGDGLTQFGRALLALNIDIICANVPNARSMRPFACWL